MTCIYIMATVRDGIASPPCKIGISQKPVARLSMVQTGSPRELVLYFAWPVNDFFISEHVGWQKDGAARHLEKWMHNKFRNFHLRGEWFRIEPTEAVGLLKSLAYDAVQRSLVERGWAWQHDAWFPHQVTEELFSTAYGDFYDRSGATK